MPLSSSFVCVEHIVHRNGALTQQWALRYYSLRLYIRHAGRIRKITNKETHISWSLIFESQCNSLLCPLCPAVNTGSVLTILLYSVEHYWKPYGSFSLLSNSRFTVVFKKNLHWIQTSQGSILFIRVHSCTTCPSFIYAQVSHGGFVSWSLPLKYWCMFHICITHVSCPPYFSCVTAALIPAHLTYAL
jgi:hypothetical protein